MEPEMGVAMGSDLGSAIDSAMGSDSGLELEPGLVLPSHRPET